MKKNILTIIILALALMNVIMSAVIIFAIVPTSNKTNKVVTRVAQAIDLELESPDSVLNDIAVSDIQIHEIENKLTINLANSDNDNHYAIFYLSLSINKKHKDFADLEPYISENESTIKEYVTDEFSKYTIDEVREKKSMIKQQILTRIQEYFKSDFIFNVSFGNLIFE